MLRAGDVTGWAHGLACDNRRQRVTRPGLELRCGR